jgi:hypothetical protein
VRAAVTIACSRWLRRSRRVALLRLRISGTMPDYQWFYQ